MIKLNKKYVNQFVAEQEIKNYEEIVKLNNQLLVEKKGVGNDYLGWIDLPTNYNKEEFENIKKSAQKIQSDSEVLIVIGIGGSYLGAKAVIDLLNHSFYNEVAQTKVYFAGHNMSSTYMKELEEVIQDKDFSINVISKSGTTTEPAIAFRHFKKLLFAKYGAAANERIYATTDANKGALKEQAIANKWTTFVVPDNVGGRFSVLTAVGLLSIAATGINIDELMQGAQQGQKLYNNENLLENDAYLYAVLRNILYTKGKDIEILVGYEQKLQYFNEWFKQLYGESEGKDQKGIFPASVIFSTDLHSMGQYIQDGRRNIFETVINVKNVEKDITIEAEANDLDGLNYLAGKEVSYVNQKAYEATAIAHNAGNVPNIVVEIDKLDAQNVGQLIYFFEKSCAMSGYILGVNPFDQPGVEAYKKKMFELLKKPGF
ncbi:MAG: glucose-6-phosphate isomerase [Mycoplasmatales bacterium]